MLPSLFLAEPSAMMTVSQLAILLVMFSLVTTGNILGPLSLGLSYTKMRGKRVVPVTGIVAVACGASLLALVKNEPATSPFWLAIGLPIITGGVALLRLYRRPRFRENGMGDKGGKPVALFEDFRK